MIKIDILKKSYKNINETIILENTNIEISKGDKVLIKGENGSGKTTTLKIIGMLDNEFNGNYYYNDENIKSLSSKNLGLMRNETFGFVFQDYLLLDNETIKYNITIPLVYSKKYNSKEKKDRLEDISNNFDLRDLLNKKVKYLSGGEKQKVAISRALINNPEVLILDEPTAALHTNLKSNFYNYIFNNIPADTTIVLVSHDTNFFDLKEFKIYTIDNRKLINK